MRKIKKLDSNEFSFFFALHSAKGLWPFWQFKSIIFPQDDFACFQRFFHINDALISAAFEFQFQRAFRKQKRPVDEDITFLYQCNFIGIIFCKQCFPCIAGVSPHI